MWENERQWQTCGKTILACADRLNYLKKKKHTVVLEINMVDVILCFSQDKMGNKRFYIRL